jgi:hypothetical protein
VVVNLSQPVGAKIPYDEVGILENDAYVETGQKDMVDLVGILVNDAYVSTGQKDVSD